MPKTPVSLLPFLASFLFFTGFANTIYGQTTFIKGKITDTTEKRDLFNSSVLLLQQSDSVLVRSTRTNKEGNFLLKGIAPGHYLILVTYPSYADYADSLEIKDSLPVNLPPIGLVLKSALLEQVVVTGNKGAIHIKGDTVEFRADSFRTQAGANVEELLKKLPGIQVDKNGKITAQGQKIQKVLVDGEEFFGDDPTLVTQNLRADMVDKVQVYDKKSDQAAFTGIDDGEKTKTINLKLKDSKKNGYFGRVSAAAGTDGYYDNQVMLNLFKKKQKLAAYGIISNTGKTGLNWGDRNTYGQSFANNLDFDETTGDLSFSGNFDDLDSWDGRYNGQGLPTVKTGGIHYNDKWKDDLQSLNANYKFMQLDVKNSSQTNSQFILPDTFYYNNQRSASVDRIQRHSADVSYEVKFDSTSTLKIMADGGKDHKNTHSDFYSEALARDSSVVNSSDRTVSTLGDVRTLNSNLLWRKKLPKKGRTISLNFRENYNNNASDGYLFSNTQFYEKGLPLADSIVDQYKNYRSENILLDSRITYTEPLSLHSFLSVNYGVSLNNNHSDRSSYNKSANGKYGTLDSLYSNNYQFNIFSQKGGLVYSFIKKKLRFNAGGNIGFTNYEQRDLHADTSSKRNFINWYPQASLSYSFTSQKRLSFNYNGSMTQPTLQQIQPIRNNEDNLNIILGNPDLKAQFRNEVRLLFNDYKVITDRSIWASAGYVFTPNAISTDVNVYAGGKRITQAVNVNGNYSIFSNIEYDFKWRKPDLHIHFSGNANQNHLVSVVNGLTNTTSSGDYSFGAGFYKAKEKKYEIGFNGRMTYTRSESSINSGIRTEYWTYSLSPNVDLFLPKKFQIHADCDVNLRQKTSVFTNNNNTVLLYGWIGKKFLKNDALLLKASGNDLLNQNIGFNRTVNSNFISQTRYTTIKRYFQFSVTWNFTKAGTTAPINRD
ncbi:outer membrane beta-barrel protein [Flavitalea flava]